MPQWGLTWLNQVQCLYQHLCLFDSEVLREIQFSARVIKFYRSILERIFEAEDSNRVKLIQNTKDEIQRLKKRKNHIHEYVDSKITSLEYQELKMANDLKVFEKERSIKGMNEELSPYKEYLNKHVPALEDFTSLYQKVDGKTKKQILSCSFSILKMEKLQLLSTHHQ